MSEREPLLLLPNARRKKAKHTDRIYIGSTNALQSRVGGMAVVGLRGRSEPDAKAARMRERARRRRRGAQGAEQAKGPATAMPPTRDV